jgi:hypothetical protein
MMTAVGDNRPDALTEAIFQGSVWFVELESNFANFADRVLTPECPRGINKGMRNTRDLTDEQWNIFDPLIPNQGDEEMVEGDLGKAADPS